MVTDLFLDFALISGLLVVAPLLRTWVRLFQVMFLPTPILAGLIGLAAGPEGLDLLPFARDAAGAPVMTRYPGELVVVLFATLFMGWRPNAPRFREMLRDAGDTFFYNLSAWIGQFGLALLFAGMVVIPLFEEVGGPFALMLPAGFVGGHGTATAVGSILAERGIPDAIPVGYTFATIGLLAAVLGGVAAINLATRAGWTRLVSSPRQLPEDQRRGLIAPEDARDAVKETVSPLALDTLSWHFGLVLLAYGAAHAASWALRSAGGLFTALPMFALAVICGALIQDPAQRAGRWPQRGPGDDGAHRIFGLGLSGGLRGGRDPAHHGGCVCGAHPRDVRVRLRPCGSHHVVDRPPDVPQLLVRARPVHVWVRHRGGGDGDRAAPCPWTPSRNPARWTTMAWRTSPSR